MPADLTVAIGGVATPVYLGENTELAALKAAEAEAAAAALTADLGKLDELSGLLDATPVTAFIGVASPATGTGWPSGKPALARVIQATDEITSLQYWSVGENVTIYAVTPTNVVAGFATNASVIDTAGAPSIGPTYTAPGVLVTVPAATLATLGDLTGKVLVVGVGQTSSVSGTPTGNSQWVSINTGTNVATLQTANQIQLKLNYVSGYTYALDPALSGDALVELIEAAPSEDLTALKTAVREYGFFPEELGRTTTVSPNDIPTITAGANDAASTINASGAGAPNVVLTDMRLKWLAGLTRVGGGGEYYPRGGWYGAGRTGQYGSFEFLHTGTALEVCVQIPGITDDLRVLVNDRIAAVTSVPTAAASWRYIKLVFPTSATRRIRFEASQIAFRGVNVTAPTTEIAATGRTYPLVTWMGDSFDGDAGGGFDNQAPATLRALGFNPCISGVGGTGLLQPGTAPKVVWTDTTRMADLTLAGVTDALGGPTAPAMGVLKMTINDAGVPSTLWNGAATLKQAIKDAVWKLVDAWIAANPGKPLVIIGPTWVNGSPQLDLFEVRDGGKEVAAAAHKSNVHFIDRLLPGPGLRAGSNDFVSTTGNPVSGSTTLGGLATTAGVAYGAAVFINGVRVGSVAGSPAITSNSVTLSKPAPTTATGATVEFRSSQTALYTANVSGDTTHPSRDGDNADALWMAREIKRIVLAELS